MRTIKALSFEDVFWRLLGLSALILLMFLLINRSVLLAIPVMASSQTSQVSQNSPSASAAPIIKLIQKSDNIVAFAKSTSGTIIDDSWQNFKTNNSTAPNCDSQDIFGAASSTSRSVFTTVSENSYWVCFRVKDSNNVYGYAKRQIYISAGVIVFTQNNNTVTASGVGLSNFAYSTSSNIPICNASNNSVTYTNGSFVTGLADNHWVCFKAKNSSNVWQYAKYRVDLSSSSLEVQATSKAVFASIESLSVSLNLSDGFGRSVSLDGNRLAIGATLDDGVSGNNTGAVYVFLRRVDAWSLEQKIADENVGFTALSSGDYFGISVALSGDRLAVGADRDSGHSGDDAGAVYIFKRDSNNVWNLEQEIADQEEVSGRDDIFHHLKRNDRFGADISLEGDYLVVGARGDDGYDGTATGAVYIFKRDSNNVWNLEQEIADQNSSFTHLQRSDKFGSAVVLDNGRLAVGAPGDDGDSGNATGAVYIFKRDSDGVWRLEQEISDQDVGFDHLESYDYFGNSLSLDGDRLAVGAFNDDGHSGDDTGAVYIFKRDSNNVWNLEQEIADQISGFDPLGSEDEFGISVALSGERLAVGAHQASGHSGNYTGAVYIFKRTGTTWSSEKDLKDQSSGFDHLQRLDYFGYSVALDSTRLVVGNSGSYNTVGGAYILKRTGTNWSLSQKTLVQTPISPQSWQNFKTSNSTEPNCGSQDTAFGIASSLADTVSVTGADDNKWVCFKAKNAVGVASYSKYQITATAEVTFSQNLTQVIASANIPSGRTETVDADSWQNFKTASSVAPNCNWLDTFGAASGSANTVSITSSENNYWVCFRVKNSVGVYSYAKYQIDYNPPVIDISKSGTTITATSTATDLPTSPVWKRSGPNDTSDCDSDTSLTSGNSFDDVVDGKYYCFSVTDRLGYIGYGEVQIGQEPIITVVQNLNSQGDTIVATASGVVNASWQNFKTTSSTTPNCNWQDTFGNSSSLANTVPVTSSEDSYWVCFRVKDSNNIYSYAKHQIDYSPPTIIISKHEATISASTTATDLPASPVWKRFGPNDVSDCDSDTSLTGGNSFDDVVDGKYYCFSVTDKQGHIGYGEIQIGQEPIITVVQNLNSQGDTIVATASGVVSDSWQNFKTTGSSTPDCSPQGQFGVASDSANTVNITSADNNRWICFRVRNSNNIYSYSKYQIDYNPPQISIARSGTIITATTTATDLPTTPVWKKSGPNNVSDCDNDTALTTTSTNSNKFIDIVDYKYYCFSIADKVGNVGYKEIRIGQPSSPSVPPVVVPKPNLTITQSGATLSVKSSTAVDYFDYFVSDIDPDCSSNNTTSAYTRGRKVTGLTDKQWVCFRARNRDVVYGYAKSQVDLTPPIVILTQTGKTVVASGDISLANFAYFESAIDPDCSSNNTTGTYTSGSTAIGLTDKQWVCFRAQNTKDVYGYAEIQVILSTTTAEPDQPINLPEPDEQPSDPSANQSTSSSTNPPAVIVLKTVGNTVKASGDNLTNFAFFVTDTQPECHGFNSNDTYSDGNIASGLTDNQWVCFKAKTKNNRFVYKDLQVEIVSFAPPKQKNEGRLVSLTPESTSTSTESDQSELTKLRLELVQDEDKVSVVGDMFENYQFFVADTDPDCFDSNNKAIYSQGKSIFGLTDNQWVCFKASDADNKNFYAKLRVNLPETETEAENKSNQSDDDGDQKTVNNDNSDITANIGYFILAAVVMIVLIAYALIEKRRKPQS